MAAGRHGIADVTVTLEDTPGGTPRNIENYIENGISAADMVEMVENTSLGDSWKSRIPTGVRDSDQLTIEGDWDTTPTTGSHVVLRQVAADVSPQSVGRELVVTFGDSKVWTRKVHLEKSTVKAQKGNIHKIEAVLTPTGSAVWTP